MRLTMVGRARNGSLVRPTARTPSDVFLELEWFRISRKHQETIKPGEPGCEPKGSHDGYHRWMAKRARRGHGEGSVYQRADGYWVGCVEAGRCRGGHDRKDGTICRGGERRRARVVRRTKRAVLDELSELKERGRAGVAGPDPTIGQYATWWLDHVKANEVEASSLVEYRKRVNRIVPHLGATRLRRLTVADVQRWLNQLAATGLGPATRASTLDTLSAILRHAVGARVNTWNPAEHVTRPTAAPKTDDSLDAQETKTVLAAATGDRLEALYVLCLTYGLRQGELLALRWDDIDLAAATLAVGKAKTRAGVRDLPLLAGTLEALRVHKRRQATERLGAGIWHDTGLVFCQPNGNPVSARTLCNYWRDLLAAAGVAHRRFHASRHTAATLLLEAGVPLEVVSAILGHANIGITAGTYAKVRADLKRRGLSKLDDA